MSGFASLGRLISLAMIVAGLGTVVGVATAESAQASSPNSPTAIGVTSGGTSYVGFASGGKLLKLSPNGGRKGSIPLDRDEAVDGLAVTGDDAVWVDYETSVSLLSPKGKVLEHFDHDPAKTCGDGESPYRYGGIAIGGSRIWVANRCSATMSVYGRGGALVATVDLPGGGNPRGITYGYAQGGRPATVYVALPDSSRIVAYDAGRIRNSSEPSRSTILKRPNGGAKPRPSGLAVDRYGQVTVSDVANNAVYLLDANNNFSLYRTLGHPPRASRAAGRLNNPSAIAQHDQDGSGLSGNLFIADSDNVRVQRWDIGGYTHWAKSVQAGAGGGGGDNNGGGDGCDYDLGCDGGDAAPTNTAVPSIAGIAAAGRTLTCSSGTWSGAGLGYAYQWRRDGVAIAAATATTYRVLARDAGSVLTCAVTASNALGNASAISAGLTIGGSGGGAGPVSTSLPAISGSASVGATLTCSSGGWTGLGNGYSYQWQRNNAAIAGSGSSSYVVVSADVGATLTCAVTATFAAGGSTTATSAGVSVAGPSGHAPQNSAAPSISGTAVVGQVLTCNSGTWTGEPTITYGYVWRRSGTTIDGVNAATYTLTAADSGASLGCTVVATNGYGNGAASSPAVSVASSSTAPVSTGLPTLTGSGAIGTGLTCSQGSWSGAVSSYSYAWKNNGATIGGAASSSYVVLSADAGDALTCTVTATNAIGSASATSGARTPTPAAGNSPVPTTSPTLSGSSATGQTLSCINGAWSGDGPISYVAAWQRNGETIASGWTYILTATDAGAQVRCLVVATNAAGRGAAQSGVVDGNACGSTTGVVINGGATGTTSSLVQLSIRPPGGATGVEISNDSGLAFKETRSLAADCGYSWRLDSIVGLSLPSTVYVRFVGVGATIYSDTIVVNET